MRRARQLRGEIEAEAARLELREIRDAHRELDTREAVRRRRKEEHQRQEKEAQAAAQRRQEEERQRRKREEASRRRREERDARRRALIQGAKSVVNEVYMPSDARAEALTAIERELGELPADEIPRDELFAIARGVRDRVLRPHREAEERATREREAARRRRSQETIGQVVRQLKEQNRRLDAERDAENRKSERLSYALEYAARALEHEERDGLDPDTSDEIRFAVESALTQRLTGQETTEDLEDLVDRILEHEL